jgi:hypothetical protein
VTDELEPWLEIYEVESGKRISALPLTAEPSPVISFPPAGAEGEIRRYRFVLRMVGPNFVGEL